MAVKDATECVFQVHLLLGLLVGHREDILHVLPPALVAVARHPQIESYTRGHLFVLCIKALDKYLQISPRLSRHDHIACDEPTTLKGVNVYFFYVSHYTRYFSQYLEFKFWQVTKV